MRRGAAVPQSQCEAAKWRLLLSEASRLLNDLPEELRSQSSFKSLLKISIQHFHIQSSEQLYLTLCFPCLRLFYLLFY